MTQQARRTTLLELVQAVQKYTVSDEEAVAIITRLVSSGRVVLCGILPVGRSSSPKTPRFRATRGPRLERLHTATLPLAQERATARNR